MAWRIDKSIIRGEIDNTEHGRVTGRLWLVGRDEPVTIDLQGDAWPDVAGARLTFVNPNPKPQFIKDGFRWVQQGQVGDITASKKSKVYVHAEVDRKAPPPKEYVPPTLVVKNALSLEWYDHVNGRVLVESTDFELSLSEREWELDEDDHEAQKLLNLQAMRDYLATVIQRPEPKPDSEDKWPDEMTEEEWEEGLQQSDRLTDASMEACEKFADDPDAQDKEAFVMGWDHMRGFDDDVERPWLDDLDDLDDDGAGEEWKKADDQVIIDAGEDAIGDGLDDDDYNFERDQHPVQKRAQEFAMQATAALDELGIEDRGEDPDHPADVFMRNVYQIMGKLAGVLNAGPRQMPRGMILATTRRCLNWATEAQSALSQLQALHPGEAVRAAFDGLRTELQAICDDIHAVRRELQGEP